MADVVITEFMDEAVVAQLSEQLDVEYDPGLADRRDDLTRMIGDARALVVRNRTRVDTALIERADRLKIVGRLGVGLDNIDVELCERRGIPIASGVGLNTIGVAEYVVAMALLLRRGALGATEGVLAGRWPRRDHVGRELSGEVMGLIGFGAIARAVAERAAAMGMSTIAHDPYIPADEAGVWGQTTPAPLSEVLKRADVLSVHVPKTSETSALIGESEIAAMSPGAVLINTARGGVVDERALVDALRSEHLGGAALDVFETEPLDAGAARRFNDVPNLVLTPHIAGVTEQSERRIARAIAYAIAEALSDSR